MELKATKDKREFVEREQRRVQILLEDKLASMKKIVEIQASLENFQEDHKRLNDDINELRAANQLLEACIQGLYNDK